MSDGLLDSSSQDQEEEGEEEEGEEEVEALTVKSQAAALGLDYNASSNNSEMEFDEISERYDPADEASLLN